MVVYTGSRHPGCRYVLWLHIFPVPGKKFFHTPQRINIHIGTGYAYRRTVCRPFFRGGSAADRNTNTPTADPDAIGYDAACSHNSANGCRHHSRNTHYSPHR